LAGMDPGPPIYSSPENDMPPYPDWLRWDLTNILAGLTSNCNPSDLQLPSNQFYRREPLC
jgi:hypothetical protein